MHLVPLRPESSLESGLTGVGPLDQTRADPMLSVLNAHCVGHSEHHLFPAANPQLLGFFPPVLNADK